MKCVKNKTTEKVTRVKDGVATRLVASGTHVYTNKKEWKDTGRNTNL